jgi:8-hydroxy-5-deazaflavin:NADPH oxidoreductase
MSGSISIIGAGNMASALAGRALAGGNAVEIIGRDPKGRGVGRRVRRRHGWDDGCRPAGDIVILAVPYASAAAVMSNYGNALRGKAIVDITNPITPDLSGFLTLQGTFGTQEIAKDAPAGAHVVKAFNTVPSGVLAAGSAEGRPLDVFIAGDDAEAKVSVSAFVESLGMRPLDTGPLPMARALEHANILS